MTLKKTSDLTRGLAPWVMLLLVSGAGLGLALRSETVAGQPIQHREETLARPLRSSGAEVHGYVVAGAQSTAATTGLHFLPDITAYLRNLTTHAESPRVQTDLKGFFMVPRQPAGKYELCLEAPGYASACPRQLTIASQMVFLPPTPITPKRHALTGIVLLKGGEPCGFSDPVLGVQFDTRVRVVGAGGKEMAPPVRANFAGQYLVPAVPADSLQVQAACEAATATKSLSAGRSMVANLTLSNQPPSLVTVVARRGNRAMRRAGPGETVEVTASARDSDDLHYSWAVSGSAKPFEARDSKTVQWTLPASPGLHSIYVLVRDGKGGVSLGRRDLSTDASSLLFTGTAQDPNGRPVEGAEVELSGLRGGEAAEKPITARTNKAGSFFLAPKEESDRYVLTIRKPGYQILSRVLTGPIVGVRYELVPAQKFSFNAGQGGQLAEKGDPRCSTQSQTWGNQYWARYSLRERVERWRRERRRCGAQVIIPPGALIDGNGKAFSGSVSASVSSVDLRDPDDRFPGEYGGLNRDRREVGLNSLGVVDVTLTDANGQPLRLAAGQTAVVRIPIDPLQLGMPGMPASPPTTIPIWFYDSKTGIWNEEGEGKLAGDYYEAVVKHFSSINADVEFTTPACMRVHTDATKIPIPYQLRVSIPEVAPVKVITQTIDDPLSVVVRLPENTNIKFEVLDSAGNVIQLSKTVQQTNGTSSPTFPVYDYASCTSDVNLTLVAPTNSGFLNFYANSAVEADEYYAKIDPTATTGPGTVSSAGTTVTGAGGANFTAPFFEAGHIIRAAGQVRTITLVTDASNLTTETAFSPPLPAGTTYERVGAKQTLTSWKTANGFGTDDQDAVYLNKPDLGLGRWMHKKVNGGNIAYYVSNYGVPPNFGSADLAAFAKLSNNPSLGLIATVAMEYSPHPTLPGGSYTKFYVFNAGGARVNKADLDGNGAKYVPKLCMVCHGGAPGSVTSDVRGDGLARFIPFDAESLGYATIDDPANPGAFTQAGQETAFKEMNRGIRDLTNVSPANLELIEGWYGGAALPGATQNGGYVHKGWRLTGTGSPAGTSPVDKAALYTQVVKPSCRSCHNTRDNTPSASSFNISWDAWDGGNGFKQDGPTIKAYVCGPGRIMPHAKVTFNNFWLSTSPHRPAALGNGGLDTFLPGDPCPAP